MKIRLKQLRRLIREEVENVLAGKKHKTTDELWPDENAPDFDMEQIEFDEDAVAKYIPTIIPEYVTWEDVQRLSPAAAEQFKIQTEYEDGPFDYSTAKFSISYYDGPQLYPGQGPWDGGNWEIFTDKTMGILAYDAPTGVSNVQLEWNPNEGEWE
jgi:hypothetical protein